VSYYYEMPDGSRLNQEQWNDYKQKKIEAEIAAEWQAQNQAARLVAELSEAYKACTGFMKSHPELARKVGDAEAQEHDLYLKLRQNLERADSAPRCEKVREDGTVCSCPRMKGYSYCYAHERMLQARPRKLALPALEDANAIQMAIMMVQKALIDDEISEKKAGLLLYSFQIAASNVKQTTFIHEEDKEVVTEMPEEALSSQHSVVSQGKSLTTKDTKEHEGNAGSTWDRNAEGSGDREKVALGVGQLGVGEIKSKSKTGKKPRQHPPRRHGGTEKYRIG
jgi:hypothetical protein